MGLNTWFLNFKLGRVEQKLKSLHARQRQIRDEIAKTETARREGKITAAEFEQRMGKLQREKHDVVDRVNALSAEESTLRKQRKTAAA